MAEESPALVTTAFHTWCAAAHSSWVLDDLVCYCRAAPGPGVEFRGPGLHGSWLPACGAAVAPGSPSSQLLRWLLLWCSGQGALLRVAAARVYSLGKEGAGKPPRPNLKLCVCPALFPQECKQWRPPHLCAGESSSHSPANGGCFSSEN